MAQNPSSSWNLEVLSRAVAFQNLSGAASHVGISQPQLSRIVAKLEEEIGGVLLNREVKRHSSWTPLAHQLSRIYLKSSRHLSSEIEQLVGATRHVQMRVGTLEGLVPAANRFAERLLTKMAVRIVELDVYDLSPLEEHFFKGELDFILTAREPGRKKHKNSFLLGYQSIDEITRPGSKVRVRSSFEFGIQAQKEKGKEHDQVLISNSLAARKDRLENFGGSGFIPSEFRRTKGASGSSKSENQVYLIGAESIPRDFWNELKPASWV